MAPHSFDLSDTDDWELLQPEWHDGYAFLDGALLGDEIVRDTYIMLDPVSGTSRSIAQRALEQGYRPTPLAARQPLWRHRAHSALLRDAQRDYYLLARYHERYGYYPVKPLPFRFAAGLNEVGRGYWRDSAQVYYFSVYDVAVLDGSVPADFGLLAADPDAAPAGSNLAGDGKSVFHDGCRVAAASDEIREINHPHYLIINGQVCWLGYDAPQPLHQKNGSPLPVLDPGGFHMIASRWGTDGRSIIVQAQSGSSVSYIYFYRIDDADLPSFVVLNERYAKDARRAYYLTGKTIRYTGEFRLLREWCPDFDEMGRTTGGHERDSAMLAVDDLYVYAAGVKIRGAHGPTFRHLGFNYFRDREHVYLRNKRVDADVDIDSFVVAQVYGGGYDERRALLVGDRRGPLGSDGVIGPEDLARWTPFFEAHPHLQDYWWHRLKAQERDTPAPEQAELLRDIGQGFALGRQVHFHGRPVQGLDPQSFRLLSRHLCGDSNGLYLIPFHSPGEHLPERFSDAPAECFLGLDPGPLYLSDGSTVFCHQIFYHLPAPVLKADLPTFEAHGNGWAKDKRAVYYFGRVKKDLDPVRTTIAGNYAFTHDAMFVDGKRLDVDFTPEEVSVPHPGFLMLGTRKLYFGRRPISTSRVDLATLQFLGGGFARDRRRWYVHDSQFGLKEVSEADYLASRTGDGA